MNINCLDNKKILDLCNQSSCFFWLPKITGYISQALNHYMNEQNFSYIKVPSLNPANAEKSINIYLEYKNYKLELSSSNAMKIGALSSIYDRVYTNSTVFRNEYNTDHHLIEFDLLEAEWKENDYNSLIQFIESLIKYTSEVYNDYIMQNGITDLFPKSDINIPFQRIKYADIPELLKNKDKPLIPEELGIFYDTALSSIIEQPTIVMFYPPKASWRAKIINQQEGLIFNFLLPHGYGELVECSIRETNLTLMKNKFKNINLYKEFEWYVNSLKYDSTTRCGFGIGIERLSSWLTQTKRISDTQAFPRIFENFGG